MIERRTMIKGALGTALAFRLALDAQAQPVWPSSPVRLVVPFQAGGPTDVFARRYAQRATVLLPQPMIVENRSGAGGTLGASQVARAAPDGLSLLFGSSSTHVTGPLMISPAPYDPIKDFVLLNVGAVPMVLAVNAKVPARTLGELVALIRAAPGRYRYSSSGPGSINHLGGELLRQLSGGLDMLHVPYRGNAPALMAAVTEEVHFLLDTFGTALEHHRAGTIRIIAVCAETRSAVAPEIPTSAESGIPELLVSTMNLIAAPSGTPPTVVRAITDLTRRIMGDESLRQGLLAMGVEPVTDPDPETSSALYSREIERWRPIIDSAGLRAG